MEKFDYIPLLGVKFYDCSEKDFFIQAIGYNNFDFIAPAHYEYIKPIDTLHFVLSGKGTLNLYGNSYSLKKYDMFFIPKGLPVSYYPNEEEPWSYVWFELSGINSKIYTKMLGFSDKNPITYCKKGLDVEKEIIDALKALNINKDLGYYSVLSLFYKLIDICSIKTNNTQSLSSQVLSYLNLHYHNPDLQIEDICQNFNITHSVLCKTFKKEQGKTVKEQLTEIRLHRAEILLKKSQLSVEEVGVSVGYKDKFHFMKTFKKYEGISAGEFRKKYKLN